MGRWSRVVPALLVGALAGGPVPALAQGPALRGEGLGAAEHARMHALLERTLFKLDVLTLDLCFDAATAARIGEQLGAGGRLDPDGERGVVEAAMGAADALAVVWFRRGISLDQFLDGVREDQERAVRAGMLADSVHRRIQGALPIWYGFLRERRILEGDRIFHRFTPSAVRTVFVGVDGRAYLDRTSRGLDARASVLGTYFAPGASLRRGLLASVGRLPKDNAERENGEPVCAGPEAFDRPTFLEPGQLGIDTNDVEPTFDGGAQE